MIIGLKNWKKRITDLAELKEKVSLLEREVKELKEEREHIISWVRKMFTEHNILVTKSQDYLATRVNVVINGIETMIKREVEQRCSNYFKDLVESNAENTERIDVLFKKLETLIHSNKPENRYLEMPVQDLDISTRAINCLKSENILTIGELIKYTERDLLRITNFGKISLNEILAALIELDLSLVQY